ncbi:MAG: alpha-isopropylmalate synthase regulatory domain-containing protein [Myxococcota bacterium]
MYEKQKKMLSLMNEILQDDYMNLRVVSYTLTEKLDENHCQIQCELNDGETTLMVEGEGVGTIDALFDGLKSRLAGDYPSLESIRFAEFDIEGLISSEDGPETATEAEAKATVGIRNSEDKDFEFEAKAPSVSRAGIQATVAAAEYFVNSERTYVRLHEILEHYRSEGRTDLVEKYTDLMSQVVENTSYSEVVEKIRNSI